MSDNNIIIVIGRQFGSGGRALGGIIAEKLGVPFYDKELIDEAARRYGMLSDFVAQADERKPSAFRTFIETCLGNTPADFTTSSYSLNPYRIQSQTIELLAGKGGAVFVGRTADYVLRSNKNVTSIFVHASDEERAKRIMERGDCSDKGSAIELAHKKDRLREEYYNYYTGRHWGHSSNYHLSVDASLLPLEDLADLVIDFARRRSEIQAGKCRSENKQ